MPKSVEKFVGRLEELTKNIENVLDEYGCYDEDITSSLGQAVDALLQLNDELDAQMEDGED